MLLLWFCKQYSIYVLDVSLLISDEKDALLIILGKNLISTAIAKCVLATLKIYNGKMFLYHCKINILIDQKKKKWLVASL